MPSCSLGKFNLAKDSGNTILRSAITLHATVCSVLYLIVRLDVNVNIQEGLTPSHLKKAKLMFFYTRYPSSNVLKTYFPDVKVISHSCTHHVQKNKSKRLFFLRLPTCQSKTKNQQCVGGEKQKRRGFK